MVERLPLKDEAARYLGIGLRLATDGRLLIGQADFTGNFRLVGPDRRIADRFEGNKNHTRRSGESAGAGVWIDVSPFRAGARHHALSCNRACPQLSVIGSDGEIGGVGDYRRIRRKDETGGKVNHIFQRPIENSCVCHRSGHDAEDRVKDLDPSTLECSAIAGC